MTRITDDMVRVARDAYQRAYPGGIVGARNLQMRAALQAVADHLEGATPAIDRDDVNDAIGEVWPWDDSDEQARDLRSDVVDRVLALIERAS